MSKRDLNWGVGDGYGKHSTDICYKGSRIYQTGWLIKMPGRSGRGRRRIRGQSPDFCTLSIFLQPLSFGSCQSTSNYQHVWASMWQVSKLGNGHLLRGALKRWLVRVDGYIPTPSPFGWDNSEACATWRSQQGGAPLAHRGNRLDHASFAGSLPSHFFTFLLVFSWITYQINNLHTRPYLRLYF